MPDRLPDDLERLCDPALLHRPDGLTVACWTFPHWHPNPFNDRLYGQGWTEYIQMRGCRPWFPGHHQPRTPLLGELDERLPSTWETYNDGAASAISSPATSITHNTGISMASRSCRSGTCR